MGNQFGPKSFNYGTEEYNQRIYNEAMRKPPPPPPAPPKMNFPSPMPTTTSAPPRRKVSDNYKVSDYPVETRGETYSSPSEASGKAGGVLGAILIFILTAWIGNKMELQGFVAYGILLVVLAVAGFTLWSMRRLILYAAGTALFIFGLYAFFHH